MASNDTAMPDFRLGRAHGTVMVFSWMLFASTGILYARYGRKIKIKSQKQFLGEDIWFQVHRFCLVSAVVGTLLAFFLILGQAQGRWVDQATDGDRMLAHSILGAMVVGCALIQAWMALFRCHPESRFRFIFNWLHRVTGLLALTLSVPTIFLVVFVLLLYHDGFVTLMSLWSAWIVIIFIVFEIIEYRIRTKPSTASVENGNELLPTAAEEKPSQPAESDSQFDLLKLILFIVNFCVALCLVIPLVTLIWLQG